MIKNRYKGINPWTVGQMKFIEERIGIKDEYIAPMVAYFEHIRQGGNKKPKQFFKELLEVVKN